MRLFSYILGVLSGMFLTASLAVGDAIWVAFSLGGVIFCAVINALSD